MPHDKNGQLLNVGDQVIVHAIVREITASPDFCNVKLETNEKMDDSRKEGETLWLNAKQVVKQVDISLRATSSPDAPVGPQEFK